MSRSRASIAWPGLTSTSCGPSSGRRPSCRKFRETRWAAMQFLLAAIRKHYRRIRVEQWILLAVRTLVVLLVVLAMATPFLEGLGAIPVLAGQRTHRVIVLDGSLSM